MKNKNWAKISIFLAIIILVFSLINYYLAWHNIDLVINFGVEFKDTCDWVAPTECVDLRDLYINSSSRLLWLPPLIVLITIFIGYAVSKL